jgi:hypothetical protein
MGSPFRTESSDYWRRCVFLVLTRRSNEACAVKAGSWDLTKGVLTNKMKRRRLHLQLGFCHRILL